MKFKNINEGDGFKSDRFEGLVFIKSKRVNPTCCKPGYNATGVGHDTKVMFAEEEEVSKIEVK